MVVTVYFQLTTLNWFSRVHIIAYSPTVYFLLACVTGAKRGGRGEPEGEGKGEGEKHERGEREGSACYKSRCFCNPPTIFSSKREWSWQDLLSYNLIKHRDGHKEQNIGQPETRIMKAKENYKQLSKRSTGSFYQSFSSLFANHLKLHSRRYMFLRKRRSFEYRHCRCLARIAIALNRCSVYGQIQYTKPPEHLCLLNKLLQLVLVRVLTWSCYMIGVILIFQSLCQ